MVFVMMLMNAFKVAMTVTIMQIASITMVALDVCANAGIEVMEEFVMMKTNAKKIPLVVSSMHIALTLMAVLNVIAKITGLATD